MNTPRIDGYMTEDGYNMMEEFTRDLVSYMFNGGDSDDFLEPTDVFDRQTSATTAAKAHG